jgi:hypothetical protein
MSVSLPHICLQVNSFSGQNNQQTKFRTIAINDGRSAATQVRLTLFYPSATIINFTIPFHNENITSLKYEKPSSLVIQLQRLSMGASIIMNTTIMENMVTPGLLIIAMLYMRLRIKVPTLSLIQVLPLLE